MHVLVVEPNARARSELSAALRREGHQVAVAADGMEALAATGSAGTPELIVSEILTPRIDGFALCRELRRRPDTASLPFLFYTDSDDPAAQGLARRLGASGFIAKAAGLEALLARVRELQTPGVAASHPHAELLDDAAGPQFRYEHLSCLYQLLERKVRVLEQANADAEPLHQARLRLALEAGRIGIWDWDIGSGRIVWSRRHEALWGLAPGVFQGTIEEVLAPIHPEDRAALDEAVQAALETGRPFRHEYRVLRPDGSVRWIAGRGEPFYDDSGTPVRMIGTAMDITESRDAEEALRESRRAYATLLANLPGMAYRCRNDAHWTMDFVSEGSLQLTGYPPRAFIEGTPTYAEIMHPEDRAQVWDEVQAALAEGRPFQLIYRIRTRSGEEKVVWERGRAIALPDGATGHLEGFISDITERHRAEQKFRRLNRVHAMLSAINSLIVRVRERDELFREAARIAVEAGQVHAAWIGVVDHTHNRLRLLAWAGEDRGMLHVIEPRMSLEAGPDGRYSLVGQAVAERRALAAEDVLQDARVVIGETLASRGIRSVIALPLVVDGEAVAVLSLLAREPGFFDDAETQLLSQLAADIAFALDHIGKEERLSYLAYYDALTGLANRALFHERLEQFVHGAERDRRGLALCMIDLDHFKDVNDSLGRQAGDALLEQFGQRLLGCVKDAGQLARLEADRFALVLPGIAAAGEVAETIEALTPRWTGEPFLLGGDELRLAARVGVALFPADGRDADTLFRNSEAALKKTKTSGERLLFYNQQMTDRVGEKLALETRLRRALERREFEVHYQPKVDTRTRAIVGVEALIRWRDPEEGLVMPMKFIPVLEETGLIADIGAWVLQQAVRDHEAWRAQGLPAPPVAVNVSAVQLRRRDFPDTVRRALGAAGAPVPVELEITESVLMENIDANVELLQALHRDGIGISIDDFGTGYSSLGYLARLPVQTLKIDLSFVDRMLTERDVLTLVSTMISLAHSMRLKVVAEGVETEQQAGVLRRLKCDQLQGYLISPPVPGERIAQMLRDAGSAEARDAENPDARRQSRA